MNYLFVHQNFPGQYYHYIRHLQRDPSNRIVFISEPNQNRMQGVRRAFYRMQPVERDHIHPHARDWDFAARRAEHVAKAADNLKRLGFTPDIIIGHHGWGELLDIGDVWPRTPLLGYFEFYYATEGQDVAYDPEFPVTPDRFARIRAMNIINLLALALDQHGQTPTRWQLTRYPEWARAKLHLLPEGAQLDVCKPDPKAAQKPFELNGFVVAPGERLVTYVCRNLEPYRGFHVMMRALPRLLGERRDVRVILVGGDDVSYGARLAEGTWREHMQRELAGQYDTSRVLFAGQVPYATYVRLLQRSDAHAYLSYPFVASWSLREALACGCQIVAADVEPVTEFIAHDVNGLLVAGLDPEAVAAALIGAVSDARRGKRLRAGARRYAEANLDMRDHFAAYDRLTSSIMGVAPRARPKAAPKAGPKAGDEAVAIASPRRRSRTG